MALRPLCDRVFGQVRGAYPVLGSRIPRNRVVRSATLVAAYTGAFVPLSQLPGAAAQFVSIVPVAIIASWLGLRSGLLAALLFIPLLAALSVVFQGQSWTYLLFEGRPAALLSLIAMAAVAGHARDLRSRLDEQLVNSDSVLLKVDRLANDRAHLISLGIELADAHSVTEVHQVVDSLIKRRIAVDRIAITDIDRDARTVTITHVSGAVVAGFGVGDRFELDDEWMKRIDLHRSAMGDTEFTLPSDQNENWRAAGFKSTLRVPLRTRDSVTGYLAVLAYRPDAFSDSDSQLLLSVAQHVAPHVRAASLLDASIKEAGLRRAQSEVARAMSMNAGLDTLCGVAGIQIEALLSFDLGFIAEAQQGMDTLKVRHTFGKRSAIIAKDRSFAWDPDFVNLDDDVRYWDLGKLEIGDGVYPFSIFAAEGFKSVAMVTLMTEGEPIGWLVMASASRSLDGEYTSQLMRGIGSHLANAMVKGRVETEQKRLLEQLAAQNSELRAARARLLESENEVKKQNKELQRANEAKNTFLSSVSHELKTPLAIMIGFAELLGMNVAGNLNEQQQDQLRMVERNGRHLDLLVSDLVDVSRIESGRLAVNLEPTRPGEVLLEILTGLDSIAGEKQQRIVRELDLADAWVRADRARLGQIVTNLVTNACKYSPAKSDIVVGACIDDHELVVVVKDSGLGISKEDQQKLFTPFFRSSNEEAQKEKGTGLGLVITRSIVEMHGGTLQLDSDIGRGTTITVRMPGVMDEPYKEPAARKPVVRGSVATQSVDKQLEKTDAA
ncbi:MAG: ATP-binding protein [Chloroflexi bacterium]|nr:ATP-binding protein [Chloroflexota bacterium]